MGTKYIEASLKNSDYISKVLKKMQKHIDISLPKVLKGEAVAICKTCVKLADVAKQETLVAKGRRLAFRENNYSLTTGKKGGVKGRLWFHEAGTYYNKSKGQYYLFLVDTHSTYDNFKITHRLSNRLWSKAKASMSNLLVDVDDYVQDFLDRRGLVAASWLRTALSVGFTTSQVESCPPKNLGSGESGKFKRDLLRTLGVRFMYSGTRTQMSGAGRKQEIICFNGSRVAARTDRGRLRRAIISRGRAFEKAMSKGVFNCAERIEKQYAYVRFVPPAVDD